MELQRERWLELIREEPLEPDLSICDPHHHLWDSPDDLPESRVRASHRHIRHYLLKELLKDIGGGHNIVQTVFIECGSMYRKKAHRNFVLSVKRSLCRVLPPKVRAGNTEISLLPQESWVLQISP